MTKVPKSTLARISSGDTSPTMDQMEQLARGLKIRISDLYTSDYQ